MNKEIKKYEVMNLLIGACPSYKIRWEEYLKDNYEENEEPLLYSDLSDFARHLAELHENGQNEEFFDIFEVVEKLHLDGDEFVKEATTIGLLEDIQHQVINLEGLKKYLHPETLRWWNNLDDFCSRKRPYVGDPPVKFVSPNQKKIAHIFNRSNGDTFKYELYILDKDKTLSDSSIVCFASNHLFEVAWLNGKTLQVRYARNAQNVVMKKRINDIKIQYTIK
ncbi:hypothetical protein ACFCYN_24585 [Gottfriedia sp. NPDC056225]|uniref:DUF7674 family protein n=1 Tax=Gottfriedia sp. NPDC056225 TaxID=3345751 RepID=UPI0035DFDBEB